MLNAQTPGQARRPAVCRSSARDVSQTAQVSNRRTVFAQLAAVAALVSLQPSAALAAGGLPVEEVKVLCDAACVSSLESIEMVTLPSGLQYRDLTVGKGPLPPKGYQVIVDYVAMTPNGRVFESSIQLGTPYTIRVGSGQVIPGLDEGIRTMRPGGLRRLYVPGPLSFPKILKAAAGRPSVPAASPTVWDVALRYIPGLEDDEDILSL